MIKLLTLTAAMTLTAGVAHAKCGDVSITEMNWASSAVVTHVSKFIMEQGYGCSVSTVPSSTTPALVSVAETGTPDIVTELWTNGTPAYKELSESGKIKTIADVLSDGGIEGWWVPKSLVDERPELATVEGIIANKELFGGRFHSCPDGWGCKNVNADMTKNYGLVDAGFEIFQHGSGETLATSIAAAFENNEPWLGYYWAPTAVLGKYPMVSIDLGAHDPEVFACMADPDCDAVGKSSWPIGPVKTVVTADFQTRNPEIADLMSKVSFTNAQMGEVLSWKEVNSASNEEAAVHFLTTYPDVWSKWITDDAKTKLSALIK
ncbi:MULTISPECIES: ABC transporter substrate-binding protein [unclassified Lentilitoribacter]|jgi:glycine betaine/proline transport system substrate-binding protein|uniref:ABC transporter substrate-binding protein n=1 Tax=unclassified Lentilitoribacter TaxID=2647570 RepID=UPI0013A6F1E4|nr:ABC transporter substrate-binding protein [Lentilitoribacter sp. Alg239-R112]